MIIMSFKGSIFIFSTIFNCIGYNREKKYDIIYEKKKEILEDIKKFYDLFIK